MGQLVTTTLSRIQVLDLDLSCRASVRITAPAVLATLRGASRLGDWYLSVLTALFVLGFHPAATAGRFVAASLVGLALQQALKRTCGRTRPCLVAGGPPQRTAYPDAGSFPSGHTLHAVMSMVTVAGLLPPLLVIYVPLACLVAASRIVLGVHYPSDVLTGAMLGGALASVLVV